MTDNMVAQVDGEEDEGGEVLLQSEAVDEDEDDEDVVESEEEEEDEEEEEVDEGREATTARSLSLVEEHSETMLGTTALGATSMMSSTCLQREASEPSSPAMKDVKEGRRDSPCTHRPRACSSTRAIVIEKASEEGLRSTTSQTLSPPSTILQPLEVPSSFVEQNSQQHTRRRHLPTTTGRRSLALPAGCVPPGATASDPHLPSISELLEEANHNTTLATHLGCRKPQEAGRLVRKRGFGGVYTNRKARIKLLDGEVVSKSATGLIYLPSIRQSVQVKVSVTNFRVALRLLDSIVPRTISVPLAHIERVRYRLAGKQQAADSAMYASRKGLGESTIFSKLSGTTSGADEWSSGPGGGGGGIPAAAPGPHRSRSPSPSPPESAAGDAEGEPDVPPPAPTLNPTPMPTTQQQHPPKPRPPPMEGVLELQVKGVYLYQITMKADDVISFRKILSSYVLSTAHKDNFRKQEHFCTMHKRVCLKPSIARLEEEERKQGHVVVQEFERLTRDIPPALMHWKLSFVNKNYDVVPSYPEICIVPAAADDTLIRHVSAFRTKARFPTLSWIHSDTGASICRSAQPKVGFGKRSPHDELFISLIPQKPQPANTAAFTNSSDLQQQMPQAQTQTQPPVTPEPDDEPDFAQVVAKEPAGGPLLGKEPSLLATASNLFSAAGSYYLGTGQAARERSHALLPNGNGGCVQAIQLETLSPKQAGDRAPLESGSIHYDEPTSTPQTTQNASLVILDCRPFANAVANRSRAGGYEDEKYYPNTTYENADLGNIHEINHSLKLLRKLVESPPPPANGAFASAMLSTGWHKHLERIICTAIRVVNIVDSGKDVLVHCSDGWDRTPQVVSLAKILLDPYYRTFEGFQVLVKHEWLALGHKFSDRHFNSESAMERSEVSPIFMQWMECVWQVWKQYPTQFEFSEKFLSYILYHSTSGRFSTFMFNSEKERVEAGNIGVSFWAHLNSPEQWCHRPEFANILYSPNYAAIIKPVNWPRMLLFWEEVHAQLDHEWTDLWNDQQVNEKLMQLGRELEDHRTKRPKLEAALQQRVSGLDSFHTVKHLANLVDNKKGAASAMRQLLEDTVLARVSDRIDVIEGSRPRSCSNTSIALDIYRGQGTPSVLGPGGRWVPDNMAPCCAACLRPFQWWRRRHHCRVCGNVYCAAHSRSRCALVDHPSAGSVRVCDACYAIISKEAEKELSSGTVVPANASANPSSVAATVVQWSTGYPSCTQQ